MDAVTLGGLIRARQVSPVEVIEAVAARMEALEPSLHAFCTPTVETARQDAERLEAALRAGRPVGPLAGVPVGIKDLVLTKGVRTTFGSVAYRDFMPEEDDIAVERLKAAGAVVLGKTNVPELGYSGDGQNALFEATRNPWRLDHTPGGSSAGSGVAVAAGLGPLALGSDGGGSIRLPASFCGIYGFKPSMGRVPLYPGCRDERYPGVSSWESLEHLGPMSRTVADSALMLSVIAGPDDRDRHSLPEASFDWRDALRGGVQGLRVAYSSDWGYATVDPRVRAIAGDAVSVFERDLGCVVEEAHPGWDDPLDAFFALVALETDLRGLRALVERFGERMSARVRRLAERRWTAEEFTDAVLARKAVSNAMWRFMRRHDLLLTPTVSLPPFPAAVPGQPAPPAVDPSRLIAFTFPINLTGQPAASVPAGWTDDGLPVGLQIVGRHLGDATVLRASAAYEAARPWRDRWPPIAATAG
jgi:aspartyl-tRNA(Asn)/glutamyl-tRNA(Gln) amidotransferase subunit A